MDTARCTWTALGCSVDVLVRDPKHLEAATAAVGAVLDDVDLALSRFRADSELSRLNSAPERRVRVSPLLGLAIDAALRAGGLTGGAVDLTVGRAMRSIGYAVDFAEIRDTGPLELTIRPAPGWRAVQFDRASSTVARPPGVEIDLGCIGKALAADLAVARAAAQAGTGVLVSLGGDIATAGHPPADGWRIAIAEDSRIAVEDADEAIGIRDGAVATSSTAARRWERDGVQLNHVIDPATGQPVRGWWRTATVIAGTCVDANIASTAAIVMGPAAADWLGGIGLPARLVSVDGTIMRVGRWPTGMVA